MGSSEGEALVYSWPFYLHLTRFLLPLTLLVLVLLKSNRTRDAWLVLILALALPHLVDVLLQWSGSTRYLGHVNDGVIIFAFYMASLWLLSNRLPRARRSVSMVYAIGLLVLGGMFGFAGVSKLSLSIPTTEALVAYAVLASVALASMAFAGVACRKRYSPGRFLLWYGITVVPMGGGLAALITGLVFLPRLGGGLSTPYVQFYLFNIILPMSLIGVVLFVAMLPFLALAFWSPTFRPRFHALFRLPGMDPGQDDISANLR